MKQQINEIRRMQQLAGLIKEFGDVSDSDFAYEKVGRYIQSAINEFPNEDDRDELDNAFERAVPGSDADIFAIVDKLAAGEITVEDIKTIVQDVAQSLGIK